MSGRILRLLVTDDMEEQRLSIRSCFQDRDDVQVIEATSGDDAIQKVQNEEFDLVLLDMKMPSGDEGLDVLVRIRTLSPRTQVIMMSAWGDIPKAVLAMKRGALDFLPKRQDFDELVVFRVDEFIRTSHLIADRELLIRAKYEEATTVDDPQRKGSALEQLLAALLASIEGFVEIARNAITQTEEIDIVFRNGNRSAFWQRQSEIILVECKNWRSQRLGKNEFVLFKEKMRNRLGRCKLGLLICTGSVATTVDKEMLRSSKEDLLVVPIDGKDLRQLVYSPDRTGFLQGLIDKALLT
jgi:CheY-like chemotaxis protein